MGAKPLNSLPDRIGKRKWALAEALLETSAFCRMLEEHCRTWGMVGTSDPSQRESDNQ
jgi:hypothetical protein